MAVKCPKCHSENPETLKFCGECGTQLGGDGIRGHVPDSPESGTCPLNSNAFRPGVTETLQTPVQELTTGSTFAKALRRGVLFAGRYEIIEELGRGGMGRVYRVDDKKINAEIALKLIKPEISADKKMIERFSNELKTTRMISHRNVCRMFDLGEDKATYFITMEYVAGQDLRGLIRQTSQLTVGKAIAIGRQIAEGLAEAHRLGVVHRDLKPSNIIIDKDGNARIMDFGIARSLHAKSLTGEGVIIGTPEYMSPEQVEGKEADPRSDIYSLGIILYEMLTGRAPFEGDTPLSIAVKHKTEKPRDPKELNVQIPADLSRLILRSLEKDKDKRYQSADEVRSELETIAEGHPTTTHELLKRKSVTSREITVKFTPKKFLVPGLAILAIAAAAIILWRVLPSKKLLLTAPGASRPTLAVLYFENKSGDPKLDGMRDMLSELLITSLSQSKYMSVVAGEEMYTILKRLNLAEARKYSSEDIEKIAAQTRATHVLRGSFIKAGESFIITAGLQMPGTRENPPPLQIEANSEKDVIVKVNDLARQVMQGFNLTSAQAAGDIEIEAGKITTSSPEALKYYIEGRRLQERGDNEESVAYMEKALAMDPEFAMAYRSMGVAQSALGHRAEARECFKKALGLSGRLPDNERLLIEAIWLNFGEEDYAKAIEVLERLVKIYPGHFLGQGWLSNSYLGLGDLDKAIEHAELGIQNRRTADSVCGLATYYMAKGLYQKVEDLCLSFLRDVEDNAYVHLLLGFSYLCRRQFDLAFAEHEKAYRLNPTSLYGWRGAVLFCQDDFAGAEKLLGADAKKWMLFPARGKFNEWIDSGKRNLEKAKGDQEGQRDAYNELAYVLSIAGRFDDAYQAFRQYLRLSAECRKSSGESGMPYLPSQLKADLSFKGRLQASTRSFEEARKTAEELKSLIDKGMNTKELRWYDDILGLIELGRKNYPQAAENFKSACGRLYFEANIPETFEQAALFDHLARALYESGDFDGARGEHEKITLLTIGKVGNGDIYAKAFCMQEDRRATERQGQSPRALRKIS